MHQPLARAPRACFSSAMLRFRAACKLPYSSMTGTSPVRMACSIRASSRAVSSSISEGLGSPRPVGEHRPRPTHFPQCPDDRHHFDLATAVPERLPEIAVRRTPGAERRLGLVTGIDVDEDGALVVQRDRQPSGKWRRRLPAAPR